MLASVDKNLGYLICLFQPAVIAGDGLRYSGRFYELRPCSNYSGDFQEMFFLKKLTATAVSCELYEKHNILTAVSDSSHSQHLCISPSLIVSNDEIDHFFSCLDNVLNKGVSLRSLEIITDFIKSKIK